MKLFENKNLIRVIALALIAVLGFCAPAGDYVNSGGSAAKAAETAVTDDGIDTVADAGTLSEVTAGNSAATASGSAVAEKKLPKNLIYLSDVRLFQGKNMSEAYEACAGAGYKALRSDMNEGTEKSGWGNYMSVNGSGDAVIIGYKTTRNRSQAITSLKMAEMDTGYKMFDYDEIEKTMNTGMNYLADDIVSVLAEINKNKADGDLYAGKVKDALNLYYIPYMKNKGLGDFMFDPSTDVGKIAQVLKRSNLSVITSVLSDLTMGVAGTDIAGQEGNLAKRIADNSQKIAQMKNGDYIALDSLYKDEVKDIKTSLQKFSNELEPSLKAYQDAGESMSQTFMDEHPSDALNVKLYEKLNQYTMADGTGVGKYLYHLGTTALKSKADIRDAYPLVMAMSPGQFVMFSYTGVYDAVTYMDGSSESMSDAEKAMAEVREKVKKSGLSGTKDGRIPIYPPGQDALYRSKVALTSEAMRIASAKDEYHKITQDDKDMALWTEVFTWSNRIITFAMAAYFLGTGVAWVIAHTSAKWLMTTTAMQIFTKLGWPIRILGGNMVTFIIVIVVLIVWYTVLKLKESYNYYNPDLKAVPRYMYSLEKVKNSEGKTENQYITYTPSYNGYMMEVQEPGDKYGEIKKVRYCIHDDYQDINYGDSAETIKKKEEHNKYLFSDFNAKQGKKWNALYTTKDSRAGSPICAENENDMFLLKKGEYNQSISGYKPFSSFGNENPVNLNSNQYKDDAGGIYLYYRTEETILDPEGTSYLTDGKYVSDMVIVSEKKEEDAKAAIKLKAGKYRFIDQNLTPDQGYYTYLGYSVTENVDDAIRDIRVDSISMGNSMSGGYRRNNIGYAEVGYTAEGDIVLYQTAVKSDDTDLSDRKTLTYTNDTEEEPAPGDRSSTVMSYSGAPILADFKVVDSLDKAPVGYEPIIPGSGGAAFNFNTIYDEKKDKNRRYVYFQPAVSFVPEGADVKEKKGVTYVYSDEEYVSGIQAFVLPTWKGKKSGAESDFKNRMKSMGYTPFDANLVGKHKGWYVFNDGRNYKTIEDTFERICYIGYSTTYNPFRTISDIRFYKGTSFSDSIQPSAYSSEGTYLAMDVFTFIYGSDQGYTEGLSKTKNYNGYSDGVYDGKWHYSFYPEKAESWDTGTIKEYKYNDCPARGLYVLAADENHPALRPSDILVTKESSAPSGMRPVSHMIYPYMTENFDISSWHIGTHFYIRKEKEQRGKYVSGVYVGTYTVPENKNYYHEAADDAAMFAAYGGSGGEVLKQNIAVEQKKAWYSGKFEFAKKYSYMGVSYTDDKEDAITGLIRYKFKGSSAPNRISVGGVRYDKAGDAIGNYCYYTTNSGNASPGLPITEVSFGDKLVEGNGGVVLETDRVDDAELQKKLDAIDDDDDLDTIEKIAKKVELRKESVKFETKTFNGLAGLLKVDTSDTVITDLYIGRGKSQADAAADAIKQGASFVYSYNTNLGVTGRASAEGYKKGLDFGSDSMEPVKKSAVSDYVCIGYDLIDASGEDAEYMGIRDILITEDKPYNDYGFEKDGCEYIPVSDVSLNSGTDGSELYMYATWDESDEVSSPIRALAMAKGDSIPAGTGERRYEYIMTDDGEKADLNLGATAVTGSSDALLVDHRLWLFANRYDNTAKKEALFDITDAGRKTTRMDVTINV